MARFATKLPDELKVLVVLCRAGKLFEVSDWLAAGKPHEPGPGRYVVTPFRAALDCGFHSMVEVFLRTGVEQAEKNRGLGTAMNMSRLDLIELLAAYGAELEAVDTESVMCCRNPAIVRWFIDRGRDMSGWPIAYALQYGHREFLGIYMSIRDRIPDARRQANMALRRHAREGNLKWVCLLMWAGADPRTEVPNIDGFTIDEEDLGTALQDALTYGQFEIVKKFGTDPKRDDPTRLLAGCWMCREPNVVKFLLDSGADPNGGNADGNPMRSLMRSFTYAIDPFFRSQSADAAVECLVLAAKRGGRWKPDSPHELQRVRRNVARLPTWDSSRYLRRLVDAGVFEGDLFKAFADTPKMKEMLSRSSDAMLQNFAATGQLNNSGSRRRELRGAD